MEWLVGAVRRHLGIIAGMLAEFGRGQLIAILENGLGLSRQHDSIPLQRLVNIFWQLVQGRRS